MVVVIIKERLSIRQIGSLLANAVNMKTSPVCVYGSVLCVQRLPCLQHVSDC